MNPSSLRYHKMHRPPLTRAETLARVFTSLHQALSSGDALLNFAYARCPACANPLYTVTHKAYPRPLFVFCRSCSWVDLSRLPRLNLAAFEAGGSLHTPSPSPHPKPLERALRSHLASLSVPFPRDP